MSQSQNTLKNIGKTFFVNILSQTIVSRIKSTGASCKTVYNVLSHTRITVWGDCVDLRFLVGGWFLLEGGGSCCSSRSGTAKESPDFGSSGWQQPRLERN